MNGPVELLGTYLHLARASELRRQLLVRDRLLVLAGSLSSHLQLSRVAACCRQRILEHNPQHMVRRWPDFATALEDSDFQHVLKQNQRRFPPEKAERLLDDLGIDMANERATYYSDEEYAAALLGESPESLRRRFE